MYNDKVLNRFVNPKNCGLIKGADCTGSAKSEHGTDQLRIYLKIEEDVIIDAKCKVCGCAAAISSADVAMDLIKNKTIDEALSVTNEDIVKVLNDLPIEKIQCSVMAQQAITNAIKDYRKKQLKLELKKISKK